MKPKCNHKAPSNFEPILDRTWRDFKGAFRRGPRCPTYMLHRGRQCKAKGSPEFPHFCAGYGHNDPVVGSGTEPCLQCKAERMAEVKKKLAKKLTVEKARIVANRRDHGNQAALRASMTPQDRLAEDQFMQWIESDCAANLRDLANLAEDESNLKTFLEGIASGLEALEAGDLEGGQAKLTETFAEFPGFAFTGPTSEPMPPMGGFVPMAQVSEIMAGLWLIAMQHLSPADFRHFRHAIMARTKVPGPTHPSTIIQ